MLCKIRLVLARFVSENLPFHRLYVRPWRNNFSMVRQSSSLTSFLQRSSCFQQRYCLHSKYKRKMSSHGPAKRLKGQKTSVWTEFAKLSSETKAINLGQGFPDFAVPDHVRKALIDVATSSNSMLFQYTRGYGHPRMVNAIAALYSKLNGRDLDPMEEMVVTVGAYQSLFSIFMSLVSPGDEVIIIEPFFDCYKPMVMMTEGTPRFIALKPKSDSPTSADDFELDPEELAGLFNKKTKAIIVNTPNNPLGKVYKRSELEMIADLCKKHDVLCISDEVYEFMIYSGHKHIRIATLPDMWERTLTVHSAGKIFSATGLKIGWTIGPKHLVNCLKTVIQNSSYALATPIQEAVAQCLELELSRLSQPECYLTSLAKDLEVKRDKLAYLLRDIGLAPIIPQGSYFILANVSHLDLDLSDSGDGPRDYKIVRWITRNLGVATIPCSAFYCQEHVALGEKYIRFCFIKEDSTFEKAAEKLRKWKDGV